MNNWVDSSAAIHTDELKHTWEEDNSLEDTLSVNVFGTSKCVERVHTR